MKISNLISLYSLIIISLIMMSSCNSKQEHKKRIKEIQSSDVNTVVNAAYLMGESKDSTYIPYLLNGIDDPRIAHRIKYKGISVYQSKVIALSKICGTKPSVQINHIPDSSVIAFWKNQFDNR